MNAPDKLRGGNRLQPRWVVGAHMRATLRAEFEARVEAAAAEKAEAEAWADEGSSTARGARKGSSRRGRRNRKSVSDDDDNDDSNTVAKGDNNNNNGLIPLDTAEAQQQCLTAIEQDVITAVRTSGWEHVARRERRLFDTSPDHYCAKVVKPGRQKRQNR